MPRRQDKREQDPRKPRDSGEKPDPDIGQQQDLSELDSIGGGGGNPTIRVRVYDADLSADLGDPGQADAPG